MEQRGTERESCACPARDSWQRHRRVRAGAGWGAWAAGRPGGHGQEQLSRAEGGGEPGDAAVRPHRTVSQATVGTRDSSLKVTKPTAERGRGAVGRRKTLAEARGPEGRGGGGQHLRALGPRGRVVCGRTGLGVRGEITDVPQHGQSHCCEASPNGTRHLTLPRVSILRAGDQARTGW